MEVTINFGQIFDEPIRVVDADITIKELGSRRLINVGKSDIAGGINLQNKVAHDAATMIEIGAGPSQKIFEGEDAPLAVPMLLFSYVVGPQEVT